MPRDSVSEVRASSPRPALVGVPPAGLGGGQGACMDSHTESSRGQVRGFWWASWGTAAARGAWVL